MRVTAKTLEISVVTSNMLHGQALGNARADANWIVDNFAPDIWGAQESEGYGSVLSNLTGYGYATAADRTGMGAAAQVPIMYNTKTMRLISVNAEKMHDGKAHEYPSRWVQYARFADRKDGNTIWYFNTHLNSHLEHGGQPYAIPRVELSTHHITRLAEMVTSHTTGSAICFWGGDFNVDEDADNKFNWKGFPNAIFHQYGLVSIYDELNTPADFDTHGTRKIDIIGSHNKDIRAKALRVERSPDSVHSDHRFVRATFSIDRVVKSGAQDPPKAHR